MRLTHLDLLLWLITWLLTAAALFRWRRLLPSIRAYLAFSILHNGSLFLMARSMRGYFYDYWIGQIVSGLLGFWIIASVARRALPPLWRLRCRGVRGALIFAALVVAAITGVSQLQQCDFPFLVTRIAIASWRAECWAAATACIFLALFSSSLGLKWNSALSLMGVGWILQCAGWMLTGMLLTVVWRHVDWISHANEVFAWIGLSVWVWTPARQPMFVLDDKTKTLLHAGLEVSC